MIKEIIKLANHLDSIGHKKEADAIDSILRKISLDVATPGAGGGGSDPHDTAFRAFSAKINKDLNGMPEFKKKLNTPDVSRFIKEIWDLCVVSREKFNEVFHAGVYPFSEKGKEGFIDRPDSELSEDMVKNKFKEIFPEMDHTMSKGTKPHGLIGMRVPKPTELGNFIRAVTEHTSYSDMLRDARHGKISYHGEEPHLYAPPILERALQDQESDDHDISGDGHGILGMKLKKKR
tara:strand:- start:709 stop:1410 length:702 start_codon:yes stop_codon:yes gene_type:complete